MASVCTYMMLVVSVWGVLMLGIIGFGARAGWYLNTTITDRNQASMNCFIAAGIYFVVFLYYVYKKRKQDAEYAKKVKDTVETMDLS
eukprot:TRINITY_DN1313_c0_g1_i1.p1 TRINITY_DN1313_c0_g1~~TRINITY_DN1313_c0_g1_i1.p1  ORF type:complete len:87 (+),score=18.10 TRINITY_DN1313_c0_g1_i1:59-319(+)